MGHLHPSLSFAFPSKLHRKLLPHAVTSIPDNSFNLLQVASHRQIRRPCSDHPTVLIHLCNFTLARVAT